IEVSQSGDYFAATAKACQSAPDEWNRLLFLPVADSRWTCERVLDFVSPAYGTKVSAPVIRCRTRADLPEEHAIMLIPVVSGREQTLGFFRENTENGAGAPEAVYRYHQGATLHVIIFRQKEPMIWNFGPWTSDAHFLYFQVKDRRVNRFAFCEGSFAQLRGESLISNSSPLQWLEWIRGEGGHRITCSDKAAFVSFSGSVLDSEVAI
ncbi:MAG: hypothetical protein WAL56_17050, partial [Candidatus Sulfotelmatobacter sp.]